MIYFLIPCDDITLMKNVVGVELSRYLEVRQLLSINMYGRYSRLYIMAAFSRSLVELSILSNSTMSLPKLIFMGSGVNDKRSGIYHWL